MNELMKIFMTGHLRVIYFLGIGGIGMSALARYFHANNIQVYGYDRSETPLTKALKEEGIIIHHAQDDIQKVENIGLVIYTPAIHEDAPVMKFCKEKNFPLFKRSDVLEVITQGGYNICIAGTHGKTTITTLTAHILRDSGYGCNAFLGGISVNYKTNFWRSDNPCFVVEADEYDRSFLKLSPNVAVITAMDPDHLDIYGTGEEVENAFIAFSKKLAPDGCLIIHDGLKRANELTAATKLIYAIHEGVDIFTTNIRVENHAFVFDVIFKNEFIPEVRLNMGGRHNIENALAAVAIAKYLGLDNEKIRQAVASFKGVIRRFDYIIQTNKRVLIDDYAHHPEELKALISGIKEFYPTKKCVLVFQPHLYSRTRDLADAFAQSLDMADEVVLLPLYPAREEPMDGVSSDLILQKMKLSNKQLVEKDALQAYIRASNPEVLVMAGAGDIDALVAPMKELFIEMDKQHDAS